jgi:transporter family protein
MGFIVVLCGVKGRSFYKNFTSSDAIKATFVLHVDTSWITYAFLSMAFAGLTSVLAKYGLREVSSDLALVVRTAMVFALVGINALVFQPVRQLSLLSTRSVVFLLLSGLTTALSWIFYYRAIQMGKVSTVATIDKGSILVTLILSVIFLREQVSLRMLAAAACIICGLLLLIRP